MPALDLLEDSTTINANISDARDMRDATQGDRLK